MGTEYCSSGRISCVRLIPGLLIFLIPVIFLSWFYTLGTSRGYNIFGLIFIVALFIYGNGFIAHCTTRFTHTRNTLVSQCISLFIACAALYFSWIFSIHYRCNELFFTFSPLHLLAKIRDFHASDEIRVSLEIINRVHCPPFSIRGNGLILLWLTETVLTILAIFNIADTWNKTIGFCEKCHHWTRKFAKSNSLCPIPDISRIQQELQNNQLDSLLSLTLCTPYDNHTVLSIQSCSCMELNLLTITQVAVTIRNGTPKKHSRNLLTNIIISGIMVRQIAMHFNMTPFIK